jgi:hypothetical protein
MDGEVKDGWFVRTGETFIHCAGCGQRKFHTVTGDGWVMCDTCKGVREFNILTGERKK